jgi:NADH-quinone oxidoreductase subunit G
VVSQDWEAILPALRKALVQAGKDGAIGAVLSPWMTVEEAYLLASYLKSIDSHAVFSMAPARFVGEDDKYPKDVHGKPMETTRFTIRAVKAPNRRGVELVLQHFGGSVFPMGDVLGRASAGEFKALYLVGGDPGGWITDGQTEAFDKAGTVVVHDIIGSPASAKASFVLAGGSFAERSGTFVNHSGLAQEIHKAIRGPGEAWPDVRILWELAERRGLVNLAALRKEIAEKIPAFSALVAPLGDYGVKVTG